MYAQVCILGGPMQPRATDRDANEVGEKVGQRGNPNQFVFDG